MNTTELKKLWQEEERAAHIHGWDFSHISGRCEEAPLPWDYKSVIAKYINSEMEILDYDTGGGEFLLSLKHPYSKTAATEGYPPNVALCSEKLLPMGIDFREADCRKELPFEANSFDIVLNRHGDINEKEISRVLKKGGRFITQQVGAENDRELVNLLLPHIKKSPFPDQYLDIISERLKKAGLSIVEKQECFKSIKFFDVGALVWFARIIEWEFPGFSVDGCLGRLLHAQKIIEEKGCVEGRIHRFMVVAEKK